MSEIDRDGDPSTDELFDLEEGSAELGGRDNPRPNGQTPKVNLGLTYTRSYYMPSDA